MIHALQFPHSPLRIAAKICSRQPIESQSGLDVEIVLIMWKCGRLLCCIFCTSFLFFTPTEKFLKKFNKTVMNLSLLRYIVCCGSFYCFIYAFENNSQFLVVTFSRWRWCSSVLIVIQLLMRKHVLKHLLTNITRCSFHQMAILVTNAHIFRIICKIELWKYCLSAHLHRNSCSDCIALNEVFQRQMFLSQFYIKFDLCNDIMTTF